MTDEASISPHVKEQFLKEAAERLRDLETGLLNVERGLDLNPQIRLMFRGFHGIKGIAGYVNTREIIDLSNAGETLLIHVRDNGVPFRMEWVDSLLQCHDCIRGLLDDFRDGRPPSASWDESLARLHDIIREVTTDRSPASYDQSKFFHETAGAQIKGLEVYLSKWTPGVPDPRLVKALQRKLALFSSAAEKAGRSDLVERVRSSLDALEFAKDREWTSEEIARWSLIGEDLRGMLRAGGPRRPPEQPAFGAVSSDERIQAPPRVLEIKEEYVDMLETLVNDFSTYAVRLSHDLKKMKPMIKPRAYPWLQGMESDLTRFARAFIQSLRRLHLVPLSSLSDRFPRLVRDLAKRDGKRVRLALKGMDVELEKNQVEGLSEPLTHLIRNAVDHGLETPEVRAELGKPEQGLLTLEAEARRGSVTIKLADDGKGIDFDLVRRKAVQLGVYDQEKAAGLEAHELLNLIFLTGLSTRDTANTISGRGVGLDIVRQAIDELGGSVKVDSEPGRGTEFTLTIPFDLD